MFGEATPYDLKQMASASVGHFWTLPHSQLYAEPARLARAGYLTEEQEQSGRRRKRYSLANRGREALDDWLGALTPEPYVLRDVALLKLFFGANVGELAEGQLETHRRKLAEYEALSGLSTESSPPGPWLALDLGLRHERVTVHFWSEQTRANKKKRQTRARRSPRSS
jgi:DNA-binding PadR family transcriptional regulator